VNFSRIWMGLILLLAATPALVGAQTTPAASPAAVTSPAPESGDGDDKPFKPSWDNEVGFSHTSQQAGQNTNNLTYTGTYHFDEGGSFLSGEASVSTQKVGGVASKTGTLTASGGVGIGIFTPSLSLGIQGGESALKQADGNLTLAFQLWEPFAVSLGVGASVGSHQENLVNYFPVLQLLNQSIMGQFDTASLNTSLELAYILNDWWTLSLTTSTEYDATYKVQGVKNPNISKDVNQTDRTATLTLGMDFTLTKNWILEVSPQVGQEYAPAGTFYSALAGGTVTFATPTTTNFAAGTVSISYNFQ